MGTSGKALLFFLSYYEALQDLKPMQRLEAYDAICRYGFFGIEPTPSKAFNPLWKLIKPTLDSSTKKRDDGSKGDRPQKTTGFDDDETTGFETGETTGNTTPESKKEKEKEKEMEKDKGKGIGAAGTALRRLKRRPKKERETLFQSLPDGAERIGYTATEDLKKKQIAKLEQAAQHVTAKPPDDDAETRRLKQQFMQQLNPGAAAPANIPADTGPEKPAADSTQAPAPQPSGTQAHDQTGTPSQETSPQQEPQPPPG